MLLQKGLVQGALGEQVVRGASLLRSPSGLTFTLNLFTLDKKALNLKRKRDKEMKKKKILAAKNVNT